MNHAGYALSGVVEGVSALIEVKFWAPVKISREAVRWFRENNSPTQGYGVMKISSSRGFTSSPILAYYSASKFNMSLPLDLALTSLQGFSESLHKGMEPSWNIEVFGVRTRWANVNTLDLPFLPAYADPAALPTRSYEIMKNNVFINDPNRGERALIAIS
ncbi:hypothetical protein K466DRAFT_569505 [Polyporus arcularius HHB13444]|uniref:Uncharacterized protein n=1 Tax=Polyporus arcularius HHB13444 TaxID=1314778 RepID=A0A5C3NVW2_9APHY|nr:hypothetical protein K466DRAFT_569505 [Polyporus arcularius HHB13444]